MKVRDYWPMLKQTLSAWDQHEGPRLGAALAFYTILSLSPLVVLVVALISLIVGHASAEVYVLSQVHAMVGAEGGKAVQSLMDHAQQPSARSLASLIGLGTLLFSASAVFVELRSALNKIWEVDANVSSGLWGMLRERFFSLGMVLSIGFLLMVSLVVSTLLGSLGKFVGGYLPAPAFVLSLLNFLLSFIGIAVLFGLIFKYVPETTIEWRDVRLGAILTALLFTIGKTLIGIYIVKAGVGTPYGAAGSLIVVTVWVYYSAQIFFVGAEFTHVYTQFRNRLSPETSRAVRA